MVHNPNVKRGDTVVDHYGSTRRNNKEIEGGEVKKDEIISRYQEQLLKREMTSGRTLSSMFRTPGGKRTGPKPTLDQLDNQDFNIGYFWRKR